MAQSTFTSWDVTYADLPITWKDARRRLDAHHDASG